MSDRFQAYTAAGLLQATLYEDARLADLIGHQSSLAVMAGVIAPLDGGTPERHGPASYDVDDLLLVVAPEDISAPVHAAWNPVVLISQPYRIVAELPTLPGFDPGRALARPSGPFVLVGRVQVGLAAAPEGGAQEHAFAWVNRYAVEKVEAAIELFFFFPGAEETLSLSDAPIVQPESTDTPGPSADSSASTLASPADPPALGSEPGHATA
jgi:hypothetical protein